MKVVSALVALLTGEWLLTKRKHANGGAVVLTRAGISATILYSAAVATRWLLDPKDADLRTQLFKTLSWYGPIFGACYAVFYTRFSSQWSYLAGVYNQIKETEASMSKAAQRKNQTPPPALAEWMAGFVEDAETLHLATKDTFAPVIRDWLQKQEVRKAYRVNTPNGDARLLELQRLVELSWLELGGSPRNPDPHRKQDHARHPAASKGLS